MAKKVVCKTQTKIHGKSRGAQYMFHMKQQTRVKTMNLNVSHETIDESKNNEFKCFT